MSYQPDETLPASLSERLAAAATAMKAERSKDPTWRAEAALALLVLGPDEGRLTREWAWAQVEVQQAQICDPQARHNAMLFDAWDEVQEEIHRAAGVTPDPEDILMFSYLAIELLLKGMRPRT